MSRSSPPTERVVRILRSLAAAEAPMTLTGLAHRLGLNVSTCQVILNALCEAGFAVRSDTDKTYTLGPALIYLGDAAQTLTPLLARARSIVDALDAAIGYRCTLLAPTQDELIVVHRTGRLEDYPVPAMALGPLPFAVPFGATIVASAPAAQQEAWLDRVVASPAELERYRALLDTVRGKGWCAWSYSGTTERLLPQFETLLRGLARDTHSSKVTRQVVQLLTLADSRVFLAEEIERSAALSVTMLTVPTGLPTTPLEIDVYLYERDLSRENLEGLARTAQQAAAAIRALEKGEGGDPALRRRRSPRDVRLAR